MRQILLLHHIRPFVRVCPTFSSSPFFTHHAAAAAVFLPFSTTAALQQSNASEQTAPQRAQPQLDAAQAIKMEWHLENRVARLIIDDKKVNSMTFALMDFLHNKLRELDARPEVRAVIIAASGPAFCSGHDLNELTTEAGTKMHRNVFNKCLELLAFIRQMQLPVIAEVDGIVAAAGTQLVASCDIVVASGRASFNVSGIKLGLFCATPAVPLSRCLPQKIAFDMLVTGRFIESTVAHKFGLVSRLASSAEIKREALAAAQQICDNSRAVTAMGKAFFYAQQEQNMSNAYRQATATMCDNLKWHDAQEGIAAFITRPRRKPRWTHTDQKVIKD